MKIGTSTVKQRAQIGFEADGALGVPVPATFKSKSGKFVVSPSSERKEVPGEEFPHAIFELDRWAEGSVNDATPDYRESTYQLRMLTGRPVITSPSAGKFERIYQFGDDRPTMTVEYGDDTNAGRALGVFATGASFEFSLNGRVSAYEMPLNGGGWEDGIELTPEADLTFTKLVPMSGQHTHVFIGNSVAEVRAANAVETSVLSVKTNFGTKTGRVRFFNGDEIVALYGDANVELTMKKAEALALIAALQAGGEKVILIANTYGNFVFEQIYAVGLANEGTREDESGSFVVKPTLRILKTPELPPTLRLVNDVAPYAGEAFAGSTAGQVTADEDSEG